MANGTTASSCRQKARWRSSTPSARITLRQALAELEKDGIIKKSRGCGAKICEKPAPFVHKMDFYSIVSTHEGHDGKQVTSQVLNIRRFDTPTEDVIEHLQLEPGTPVVYIKRLFLFDDKPLAVGVRGCPWRVSPVWTKQAWAKRD